MGGVPTSLWRALQRLGLPLCLGVLVAHAVLADDRDFVQKAVENPYVYILFDTTGSMAWTPSCTQADFNAGNCPQVCETGNGDCHTPLQADGAASKLYQAKQALYEVISATDNIHFGIFSLNQDTLGVRYKHWLYQVTGSFNWTGLGTYPAVGAQDVFGFTWDCVSNGNGQPPSTPGSSSIGCFGNTPARLSNAWETKRVRYYPKLGDLNNQSTQFYVRSGTTTYRVTYNPSGQALGSATLTIPVGVRRCNNSDCSSSTVLDGGSRNVTFALVDEFLAWDSEPNFNAIQEGFWDQGDLDLTAGNTCGGWDPNTDSSSDAFNGYNVRIPTETPSDPRGAVFNDGDVIPADWLDDKRDEILSRLAPAPGHFDQAFYFNDHRQGGDSFLRLKSSSQRPLLAFGSTPIARSIDNFRAWMQTPSTGWRVKAAALDPDWRCRRKYLLVLTDGDENCQSINSVCTAVDNLRVQENFRSYVVAFGIPSGTADSLKCIAEKGGQPDCVVCSATVTENCVPPSSPNAAQCGDGKGDPLYPQNKNELVEALTSIFQSIDEESRAFASAAVPSVEANVKDKIYLSDFTPIDDTSWWDGHLDGFVKPLPIDGGVPLDDPAKPNYRKCSDTVTAGCHLWDLGTELLAQAPTPAEVTAGNRKLGTGVGQRRVLYPAAGGTLRLFQPPATADNPAWLDLVGGLGFANAATSPVPAASKTRATAIIDETLQIKTETAGGVNIDYVLGDAFHSEPLSIERPGDFEDLANNSFGDDPPGECNLTSSSDRGYRCFAFKHQYRRRVLMLGTNDGQLHAFDAGRITRNSGTLPLPFSNGDGVEIFSYVPRMALPILREQAEDDKHIYGIDGPVVSADAFFRSDEQWHTIVVGAMRDGGRKLGGALVRQPETGGTGSEPVRLGYFALDVTQPDPLDATSFGFAPDAVDAGGKDPEAIPGCLSTDGSTPTGCPRPYPQRLWEFTDRSPATGQPWDEDDNGDGDLGVPWSKPVPTRIRLLTGEVDPQTQQPITEDRFVVVVGGGLDPLYKAVSQPRFGNFVYLLDAETGQPLYKREVDGSVPSVAVLDPDGDNVADVIYFGTTTGRVYKIDVSQAQQLVDVAVRDRNDVMTTVKRVAAAAWNPFVIFRTGADQPIYLQMQLLFIQRLGQFALVFGTGDRDDLWDPAAGQGRLYVIVDEGFTPTTSPALPRTEANYRQITPEGSAVSGNRNLLLDPEPGKDPGWYMLLDAKERVITKAFGASGILVVSSFQPKIEEEGGDLDRLCARSGVSRNFVVFAFNGNAVTDLDMLDADSERFFEVTDFVTSPFVEQSQTQNVTGGQPVSESAELSCSSERLQNVASVLKQNGPPNARYGNYYLRLGQRMSQRGIFVPACIPIAITERNWREN